MQILVAKRRLIVAGGATVVAGASYAGHELAPFADAAGFDNAAAPRKGAADVGGNDWGRRDRTVWHQMSGRPPEGAKGPLIIAEGDGAWVTDVEGNRYLDGLSGQWCVNAGYGRARLADAAAAQLKKLAFHPLTRGHLPAIELGERLEAMLGGDRATFYANSGSEANELAFKLVRQYHQLTRRAASASRSSPATAPTTAPRSAPCRPRARRCAASATSRSRPASCTCRRRTPTATASPTTTSTPTAAAAPRTWSARSSSSCPRPSPR